MTLLSQGTSVLMAGGDEGRSPIRSPEAAVGYDDSLDQDDNRRNNEK